MHGQQKVYGHPEWARHKSSWRHVRHLRSMFSSGVIVAIATPVACTTVIATLVTLFNELLVLAGRMPDRVPILDISSLPYSLTIAVVSLLLVFRTNSSYNRFDEARKAWGSNVNRTRDLTTRALSGISKPADSAKLLCLLRHIKAYSYCLKDHLLKEKVLGEELVGLLAPREVESLFASSHRPNFVLQVMSDLVELCEVPEWKSQSMLNDITQFYDSVGASERLFKTPIPVLYTRLISRVLSIWHLTLPFALWSSCHWLTIPATFLSSVGLDSAFCTLELLPLAYHSCHIFELCGTVLH